MTKRKDLMKLLEKKFNLTVGTSEEFYGEDSVGGIWIRDGLCTELTDYFDYEIGIEGNILNEFIKSQGWFIEPNDADTMLLWC